MSITKVEFEEQRREVLSKLRDIKGKVEELLDLEERFREEVDIMIVDLNDLTSHMEDLALYCDDEDSRMLSKAAQEVEDALWSVPAQVGTAIDDDYVEIVDKAIATLTQAKQDPGDEEDDE